MTEKKKPEWKINLTPKEKKQLVRLGIFLALGLFLMLLASVSSNNKSSFLQENPVTSSESLQTLSASVSSGEAEELEAKLEEIIGSMSGVNNVQVALVLAASSRTEYAVNVDATESQQESSGSDGSISNSTNTSKSEQIATSSGPIKVQETMAQVQGVVITAKGAENINIKAAIIQAVQSLLGLPAHRIMVYPAE